jgi:hypothetical protein
MEYSAVGLAVTGFAIGIAFRWKVLLPIICLLPCASIIFSVSGDLRFRDAAIVVIATQVILQGGYFVVLLIRPVATACIRSAPRISSFLKSRRNAEASGTKQDTVPPAGAGKGS